jgi:hypothetical protein
MCNWFKKAAFACLIVLLGDPALATPFYLAVNTSTGECHVMVTDPDGQTMRKLGEGPYQSYDEATEAMNHTPECA